MRRILLVDADVGILATLAVGMEPYFQIDTASTASEGLYRLVDFSPDLVVLDVSLQDLDGVGFLGAVHARLPTCPVVVMTAIEHGEMLREMMAHGIDGFLRKPFPIDKLLERINALLKKGGSSPHLSIPRVGRCVSGAIEYLTRHYTQSLTVRSVAEAVGVSASHLAHLFRIEMGVPVKQYLARVRIEVAKRLLVDTDEKLDNIADRVGFCDASHLSRVFRVRTGQWPGKYRQYRT